MAGESLEVLCGPSAKILPGEGGRSCAVCRGGPERRRVGAPLGGGGKVFFTKTQGTN